MIPLNPNIYYSAFETNADGKKVLDELCRVFFDKPSYVRGDTHETAFNEGSKAVVNFILHKLEKSQQGEPTNDNGDNSLD